MEHWNAEARTQWPEELTKPHPAAQEVLLGSQDIHTEDFALSQLQAVCQGSTGAADMCCVRI